LNGVTLVNSEHSSAQLSLAGDGAAAAGPELYEWRMGVTRGNVVIGDPGQLQMDRLSAKTAGLFNKGAYSFLIQKNLSNGASAPYIRMHVRGQWASKNLDGYEKFALGGPAGVRSYASDNVSVDEGVIASLDVRKSFQAEGLPLVVGGFYDFATGAINQKPWQLGFENSVIRRGFGVSLDIQPTTQSVLSLLLARPVGPERRAENYQFWATARFKY
jgi:hemolysin activation/secretion protein